jgi:HEAT repeat protein
MGTTKSIKTLEKLAADTDFNIRQAAVEALVETGAKDSATKLIAYALKGDDATKRIALVGATQLGNAQNLDDVDRLASALKTSVEKERVRLIAAQECGIKAQCWQTKLVDPNYRVREKAALELGWLKANDALEALVKTVGDEQAAVRIAAIQSLSRLKKGDLQKLKTIYKASKSKIEFNRANHALKRLIALLENAA